MAEILAGLRCKLTVTLLLALSVAGCDSKEETQTATTIVSIVGTNDRHGAMLTEDRRGGLALFGGYLNNLREARERDGGAVILLDAGDMWQGTLESNVSEGASMIAAYNALGYTAAAFGNHEFDYGPVGPKVYPQSETDDPQGAMKARAAEAEFPILAVNLIDNETGKPVAWPNVRPSLLAEIAGIRFGIIGAMTENAFSQTFPANTGGLTLLSQVASIGAEATRLRQDGAEVVLLTTHSGGDCRKFDDPNDLSSCDLKYTIFELARGLEPGLVDVIVAGHTHEGISHWVNGIAVVSAYSSGVAFDRVDLAFNRSTRAFTTTIHPPQFVCEQVDAESRACDPSEYPPEDPTPAVYEGRDVVPDASVALIVEQALQQVNDLKAEKIGVFLETPIRHGTGPESALGNLLPDAIKQSMPQADLVIHNSVGGVRADLPQGELTYGRLYEMFPFNNRLVTLYLTGAQLETVLAQQLAGEQPDGNLSGARVHAKCESGDIQVSIVRDDGSVIGDDETLAVITTDFVAMGGDDILAPIIPPSGFGFDLYGPMLRDVVADWFRQAGGTMNEAQFLNPDNPRWNFDGELPADCE